MRRLEFPLETVVQQLRGMLHFGRGGFLYLETDEQVCQRFELRGIERRCDRLFPARPRSEGEIGVAEDAFTHNAPPVGIGTHEQRRPRRRAEAFARNFEFDRSLMNQPEGPVPPLASAGPHHFIRSAERGGSSAEYPERRQIFFRFRTAGAADLQKSPMFHRISYVFCRFRHVISPRFVLYYSVRKT